MRFPVYAGSLGCALFLQGTPHLQAQPINLSSAPANLARWMYPFNTAPGSRPNASTFAAFGNLPSFDTRDGQYLLGWNTSVAIPTNQGAANYLIGHVRVTITISSEGGQYVYDDQQHDFRTYFPTNDPNVLPNTNASSPIELYGAGFRGGYSAATFQQNTPFFASSTGGDFTNRTAYAAGYDTNGALVDVSNNVGDDGTNEIAGAFEVIPFSVGQATNAAPGELLPSGTPITFDINLNNPLIYGYIQQSLNQGTLDFMVSSLVNADYLSGGAPNWPDFYTIFNQFISTSAYPRLDIALTVVRTNLDSDADGLPDDWEQFYFGRLGLGASNSALGDGISNGAKYIAGTNPTNPDDRFQILSIRSELNATKLRFTPAPSRQYAIQWCEDLQRWQTVSNPALLYLSDWLTKTGSNQVPTAPLYAVWMDTNTISTKRFYRITTR